MYFLICISTMICAYFMIEVVKFYTVFIILSVLIVNSANHLDLDAYHALWTGLMCGFLLHFKVYVTKIMEDEKSAELIFKTKKG